MDVLFWRLFPLYDSFIWMYDARGPSCLFFLSATSTVPRYAAVFSFFLDPHSQPVSHVHIPYYVVRPLLPLLEISRSGPALTASRRLSLLANLLYYVDNHHLAWICISMLPSLFIRLLASHHFSNTRGKKCSRGCE